MVAGMMKMLKIIEERHSVRNYLPTEVEESKLREVLRAGTLAPSWMNIQSWHFIAVRDKKTRELLAKSANNRPHVLQAPVLIVCCCDFSAWEEQKFRKTLQARSDMTEERINMVLSDSLYNPKLKGNDILIARTLEQLTYAMAYMTIEAHNQGLGACIIGTVANELTNIHPDIYKEVRETLNLPDNVTIASLMTLGYPAEESTKYQKTRKAFEEAVSFEKYPGKS